MDITRLSERISVSPQIEPADIAALALQGFRSIICNRPDGEGQDQPAAAIIEAEARKHGLGFAHVPALSGAVTAADGEAMAMALASLPSPVLAYCRSGARSTGILPGAAKCR